MVDLQDGSVTREYRAQEVFGDEKALWWRRAVEAYPPYADYQRKTDRRSRSSCSSRPPSRSGLRLPSTVEPM